MYLSIKQPAGSEHNEGQFTTARTAFAFLAQSVNGIPLRSIVFEWARHDTKAFNVEPEYFH